MPPVMSLITPSSAKPLPNDDSKDAAKSLLMCPSICPVRAFMTAVAFGYSLVGACLIISGSPSRLSFMYACRSPKDTPTIFVNAGRDTPPSAYI